MAGLLVGSLASFACSGRTWRVGNGAADPVTGLASHAAVAGTQVAPAVRACALAALAGTLVLLLLRGVVARTIVAALIALVSGAATVLCLTAALSPPAHLDSTVWPWLAGASSLLAAVSGGAAVVGARRWPRPGSTRYDSPANPRRTDDDAWQALDRGEDPTL